MAPVALDRFFTFTLFLPAGVRADFAGEGVAADAQALRGIGASPAGGLQRDLDQALLEQLAQQRPDLAVVGFQQGARVLGQRLRPLGCACLRGQARQRCGLRRGLR